jgi:hypothetical protein
MTFMLENGQIELENERYRNAGGDADMKTGMI